MKKLKDFAKLIQENKDGKLEGGFELIMSSVNNILVIGGTDANNCLGGNCVTGCGNNTIAGCGGVVNNAAGCGTKG